MQWDYSTFFPAITISGHVTRMGNRPLKFAFDVAMSGRLPWFSSAICTGWKTRTLAPRALLDYVSADRSRAVLFVLQTKDAPAASAHPQGLDPQRFYRVTELDLPPGVAATHPLDGKVVPSAALLRDGLAPAGATARSSRWSRSRFDFPSP